MDAYLLTLHSQMNSFNPGHMLYYHKREIHLTHLLKVAQLCSPDLLGVPSLTFLKVNAQMKVLKKNKMIKII